MRTMSFHYVLFVSKYSMSFGLDCMNECNDNLAKNRIAACCFVCEMTHGYENQQFEDLVRCMVDNGGMPKYPDDGICYGTDEDGVRSLQAMEQVCKMSTSTF